MMDRFRKYAGTPKGKYTRHKANAKRRGVPFLLSFEEWLDIWESSGYWQERGPARYVMCRYGDVGPYAVGNVYIGTQADNLRDMRNAYIEVFPGEYALTIRGAVEPPF